MCLGIPGQVVSLYSKGHLMMGKIKFGELTKETCMSMVPEVKVGDYVIVHVGFALNIIDEEVALGAVEMLKQGL